MRKLLFLVSSFILISSLSAQNSYDIVLKGGRVMDPESGLDAIRNVGIVGDEIAQISEAELFGKEILDVSGLVVAPGFIDLHVHGMTNKAHEYQAHDGVTTALELEGGMAFLTEWLASKEGNTIVNYGATVPHGILRAFAMERYEGYLAEAKRIVANSGVQSPAYYRVLGGIQRLAYESLTESDIERMRELIKQELAAGALGIGVPVGYYPGATYDEIYRVYECAAENQAIIFSHTRGFGMTGIQEAIANATTSGASLHIVHANSLSLGDIQLTLDMVASAQKRGLDISTEIYPYTAASTSLGSALFDEGWKEELGISYGDLQWEDTGERLTKSSFERYRKRGGVVIIHMMKPEWIERGIQDPRTLIASDGMPYAPKAHPRTAGTFSRVLGRYVREKGLLTLMDALRKMTLMPAQRLEAVAPSMRRKGRLSVGADADVTIFDPALVIDKADFTGLRFSEGIVHVMVNGVWVVKDEQTVEDVFPGRAVRGGVGSKN